MADICFAPKTVSKMLERGRSFVLNMGDLVFALTAKQPESRKAVNLAGRVSL
jgi:hypothetical protein